MKYLRNYYLVDTLSETVVGSFTAPNERFAVKRVKATVSKSDDLKDIINSLRLYASTGDIEFCETYDEAIDSKVTYSIPIELLEEVNIDG